MSTKKSLRSDDIHLWRIITESQSLEAELRKILSFYAPLSASELQIEKSKNGKPYLSNIENLHFNLSHSRNLACIGISASPMGIDLEFMDLNRKIGAISSRTMSEAQLKVFENIKDDKLRLIFFYQYWTFLNLLSKPWERLSFPMHLLLKTC